MSLSASLRAYFRHAWGNAHVKDMVFVAIVLAISGLAVLAPTGYERAPDGMHRARAAILETFDQGIRHYGPVTQGEQYATVRVLAGPFKGLVGEAHNILYGKTDIDKIFKAGDTALAVIAPGIEGGPADITLVDHWRLDIQVWLVCAFLSLLVLLGGWTGVKSFVSFIFTGTVIWKVLIPAFLSGFPAILSSLAVVAILSFVIIFLVSGFSRTGLSAFLGSVMGTAISAALALALSNPYHLNGSVRSFSETLKYGGFDHLDLAQIFLAGTFLASSGAFMDLAMDVAASMEELHLKRPALGFIELAKSGLNVGRKVIGTMSTTLLLAYTGGFTSLLMVFMAQNVNPLTMFSMSYVSSEVFHTMVGSLGLVLIAPLTALLSAWLLSSQPSQKGCLP